MRKMTLRYSRENHPQNSHYTWSYFVMVRYLPLLLELMLLIIVGYYELVRAVEFALDLNSHDARHVILPRIEVVGPPDA